MKNKILAMLLISSLMSVTVIAADVTADAVDAETRIVTLNSETMEEITDNTEVASTDDASITENTEIPENEISEENIIEVTETKYIDESGFSLWYNAESLAIGDYGGQFCFVPSDVEDPLKSPAVFIIVPNEIGEAPSPLGEVTAMYPPENVSEIKEITSEEGITIQSVEASDAGQNFAFYIVSYEDMSLNITSMIFDEEHASYAKEFDRIVDTISFEQLSGEENTEEQAVA